jgi:hypothetical protein
MAVFKPKETTVTIDGQTLTAFAPDTFITTGRPNPTTGRTKGINGDLLITELITGTEQTIEVVLIRGTDDDTFLENLVYSGAKEIAGSFTTLYSTGGGSGVAKSYVFSDASFTGEGDKAYSGSDPATNATSSYTMTATLTPTATKV